MGCPTCGVRALGHGRSKVQVRDLPISGRAVRLVWRRRCLGAPALGASGARRPSPVASRPPPLAGVSRRPPRPFAPYPVGPRPAAAAAWSLGPGGSVPWARVLWGSAVSPFGPRPARWSLGSAVAPGPTLPHSPRADEGICTRDPHLGKPIRPKL
ncbi:MAG: transposase family protein [Acidimicrobiales bacterium]